MTRYYYIAPEVAGRATTRLDSTENEETLHYEVEGWLGDDLLESYPHYIVNEPLLERIEANELSGYEIADASVSKSPQFERLYPEKTLPEFYWLKIRGDAGADDFGRSDRSEDEFERSSDLLVISERALAVLNEETFNYPDIEPYEES